jgi:SAM-dependent methyltransferase
MSSETEAALDTAVTASYAHGYNSAVVGMMGRRTIDREGAFLLPHLRPGMRVLDIGSGSGSITVSIGRKVAPGDVVGIDFQSSMIDAATALAREQGVDNVRFEVGRAEALPYPDASFDAVFEHTLLEHVADPLAVLREVRRVLRSTGCVGLRGTDWGGNILVPPSPELESIFALYERFWRGKGGDPCFGRRQRSLLRAAGFARLETSAGGFSLVDPKELFVTRFGAADFIDRVVELGWSDRETCERWPADIRAWGQDQETMWVTTLFETVAWIN